MDIKRNVPLKIYSSFHTGGNADYFVEVKTDQEAIQALKFSEIEELPVFFLGAGTNILIPDEGIRGLVMKNSINFVKQENTILNVGSGVYTTTLAQIALEKELSGIETLFGLPGTIGGAIRGNAGTLGTEIKDILQSVTLINEDLTLEKVAPEALKFGYRESALKDEPRFVVSCEIKLTQGDTETIKQKMLETKNWRKEKQPGGFTAGSFFKNPPDTSAGYLIDQAGLKGFRIGEAQVSDKHANFLINTGNATSKDVMMLAAHIKKVVFEKFGTELTEEVLIINNPAL